ncbi:hypothetical protein [Actinomadura hibisca]|uniref:hypothetical protein n=1 Tax=Actinomadura hibisca TaxID=68565 RepID=UPI00082CEA3B|nr:hypothetical protein [Actinomadura hibisca]
MSVDELVDERERLIEEWDEAVEEHLADFKDYTRLIHQRERVQAEVTVFDEIYGAVIDTGSRVDGDRRQAQMGLANILLRVRYAFEEEIVETTLLKRKADGLQHLFERNQAVLSELERRLSRQYRDELDTFHQLADLHAEFARMQLSASHQAWRDTWQGAITSQEMVAEQLERFAPGSAASWRFQAPPTWPQPHPGWSPQPDWLPDPAWEISRDLKWHFWTRD